MAEIRPFPAYRPAQGLESRIAALPYDVYSREEAKQVVQANPMSFLGIDRAETQFPDSVGTYEACVYQKAREMLDDWIAKGWFVQDPAPYYYLYEQGFQGRTQTGIVACASIDDYVSGVIKKHENTRIDKEIDRIRHVDTTNAQTGPIFLCYRNDRTIDEIVEEVKRTDPICSFVSDGEVTNRVWVIRRPERIAAIRQAFAGIDRIYIADGHHRCASAVKVGLKRREQTPGYTGQEPFNFFLSVLFPENELMIMDYNRVLKSLNGYTPGEFLVELLELCNITPETEAVHPAHKGEFGLYMAGRWYRLDVRDKWRSSDPVEDLDVSILQKYVLRPTLGIEDPREDPKIDFVGGIRGLSELEHLVDTGEAVAAFSMYPTSLQELFAVADAGRLMPPKSTWFEPKLLSGLFIHRLS